MSWYLLCSWYLGLWKAHTCKFRVTFPWSWLRMHQSQQFTLSFFRMIKCPILKQNRLGLAAAFQPWQCILLLEVTTAVLFLAVSFPSRMNISATHGFSLQQPCRPFVLKKEKSLKRKMLRIWTCYGEIASWHSPASNQGIWAAPPLFVGFVKAACPCLAGTGGAS